MRTFSNIVWVIAILMAIIGAIDGYNAYTEAETITQQIGGAAIGMAWAVIPYCIARAISELAKGKSS